MAYSNGSNFDFYFVHKFVLLIHQTLRFSSHTEQIILHWVYSVVSPKGETNLYLIEICSKHFRNGKQGV